MTLEGDFISRKMGGDGAQVTPFSSSLPMQIMLKTMDLADMNVCS